MQIAEFVIKMISETEIYRFIFMISFIPIIRFNKMIYIKMLKLKYYSPIRNIYLTAIRNQILRSPNTVKIREESNVNELPCFYVLFVVSLFFLSLVLSRRE
jgi:hypothetical protein